jgi:hypothetical protein
MKKVLSIATLAAMSVFASCGGDDAAREKMRQDSIKMADSLAAIADKAKADSTNMADSMKRVADEMMMKAKADSTKMADSIAKLGKKVSSYKPAPKPTPQPTTPKPLEIKAGAKRGGN